MKHLAPLCCLALLVACPKPVPETEAPPPSEPAAGDDKVDLLVVTEQQRAWSFPLVAPAHIKRAGDDARPTCSGERQATKVLVTTRGPGERPGFWREYPLAIDAWSCGGWQLRYPRELSKDEVKAIATAAEAARKKGDLDEAELGYRRIVNSWAGYTLGHQNLGMLLVDRFEGEAGLDAATRARWRGQAIEQLKLAVESEPPPGPAVVRTLARLQVDAGTGE